MFRLTTLLIAASILLGSSGCAQRIAHHDFSEEEVGMAALREENVRSIALGPEVQAYVAKYPVFAETVNQFILKNTTGYLERYNVYAREPLTYPRTNLPEFDSFFLRAYKVAATVRVGTRLMQLVGARLSHLDDREITEGGVPEGYETLAPEALTAAIQAVRDRRGTLSLEQRKAVVKDVVALAAALQGVQDAAQLAKGVIAEGENLKQLLETPSYLAELRAKDANMADLIPEVASNVNGAIAGLRRAESDGASMAHNAKVWKLYLVNAVQ